MDAGNLLGAACLGAMAAICLVQAGDAFGRDEMPGAGLIMLVLAGGLGYLAAACLAQGFGA